MTDKTDIEAIIEIMAAMNDTIFSLKETISQLKDEITALKATMPQTVYIGNGTPQYNPCALGHDYPDPWNCTTPPTCRRCGKQAPGFIITCSNNEQATSCADSSQPTPPYIHHCE